MDAMRPNALTNLLGGCRTPEEMGEVLKRENCISDRGVEDFSGMVDQIEETWRAHPPRARRPGGPVGGPDYVDAIAEALVSSVYLNEKALQLYNTNLGDV
jgi:hypothetical protein